MSLAVTILVAGNGKRMNDGYLSHTGSVSLPKVLQLVNKEPMLVKIIKTVTLLSLPIDKLFIVVNDDNIDVIKTTLKEHLFYLYDKLFFVMQDTPQGTGHAVLQTAKYLSKYKYNIILNGDTPLLQSETLSSIYAHFLNNYKKDANNLLVVGINLNNPKSNGRIVLRNNVVQIIEYKDCNEQQRSINLVNTGIYVADTNLLLSYISQVTNKNEQNEYYLTDIVKLASENKCNVILYVLDNNKDIEIYNVNTRDELDYANKLAQ